MFHKFILGIQLYNYCMNLVRLDYRKKDKEDKYPLTSCLSCGKLNHIRRNGRYCNMYCFYVKLGIVK